MAKVLVVYQKLMSFIEKDMDILGSEHDVREFIFAGSRDISSLYRAIEDSDLTLSWFGSIHAFYTVLLSKMGRKKTVVIAGGWDVAKVPEIQYGLFNQPLKRWCPTFALRHADAVLPVSESTKKETLTNALVDPGRVHRVYHGFDANIYRRLQGVEKQDSVLTVGGIDVDRMTRKGIELFVRSARYLPRATFYIVGAWEDDSIRHLEQIASDNVVFTGKLSFQNLLEFYSRSKVYVQASVHEAFGCSLAEAMLCECVPVVSRKAALPEVVGDTGFYVKDFDPEELAHTIEEALSSPPSLGEKARLRIQQRFPIEERRGKLLEIINGLLEPGALCSYQHVT